MSKYITIGNSEAGRAVKLDVGRLIVTRLLATADSGGGKSWLLRKILEQVSRTTQTIVIDPEGEFSTLRERRDMVLAGPDGEVPAEPRSAALLCRRLMELNLSAVIDLSELTLDERREFVSSFCVTMVELPRKLWHRCFVAVDELHEFAPEGEESESEKAVAMLSTKGRKRGFCLLGATQRLSKLSKNVAAGLKNQLYGTFSLDSDIRRAAGSLGFGRDRYTEIRDLSSEEGREGEFFGFGPAFDHRGVIKMRTGEIETTHPEAGAGRAPKPPAPSAKIKGILSELKDLPQEAEAQIKDLAAAKGKIVELERELRRAAHARQQPVTVEAKADPAAIRDLRHQVRTGAATIAALKKGLEQAMKTMQDVEQSMVIDAEQVKRVVAAAAEQIVHAAESRFRSVRRQAAPLIDRLQKLIDGIPEGNTPPPPADAPARANVDRPSPRPARTMPSGTPGTGTLGKMERALLVALAQHPDGLTKQQVTILAYYRPSGDTAQAFRRFAAEGWTSGDKNTIAITPAGLEALGGFEPLPIGEKLREAKLSDPKASKLERAFFKVLFDAYPGWLSKAEIVESAGYKPSGDTAQQFRKMLKLGWIEDGKEGIRAGADFYEPFERAEAR